MYQKVLNVPSSPSEVECTYRLQTIPDMLTAGSHRYCTNTMPVNILCPRHDSMQLCSSQSHISISGLTTVGIHVTGFTILCQNSILKTIY